MMVAIFILSLIAYVLMRFIEEKSNYRYLYITHLMMGAIVVLSAWSISIGLGIILVSIIGLLSLLSPLVY